MSDPKMLAQQARERLASALGSLQAEGVPSELLDVAEPVAKAMGMLHQIENSNGASAGVQGPQTLEMVRRALSGLQVKASAHPAVQQAIESVAGSLNLVHSLTQSAQTPFAATQYAAPQPAASKPAAAAMKAEPAAGHASRPATAPATPTAQLTAAAQAHALARGPSQPPPGKGLAPASADSLHVEAALGAHSTTNFYKGLSGNDVVDSGGIFVATYQIPEMGKQVALRVSLPGGYEFEARGVVAWTREAPLSSSAGHEAPPGFGARFTEITQEGRQLIYRYVRNREPLFHDDL